MSNFKSGSGNLDFGGDDDDDEKGSSPPGEAESDSDTAAVDAKSTAYSSSESVVDADTGEEPQSEQTVRDRDPGQESSGTGSQNEKYPYFVRRSNVGDERDTRLEIHVRDKVAGREAEFRNELAARLGASEVSKTDAREFALLAAFEHPERVAELMQEEGFGALD